MSTARRGVSAGSAAPVSALGSGGILRSIGGSLLRAEKGAREFVFVATSSNPDRAGDIVEAAGVDWREWVRNPAILSAHDNRALPVATGGRPTRIHEPFDGWTIGITFPRPGASRASDEARALVEEGVLQAVSIGFKPQETRPPSAAEKKRGATGRVFTRSVVYEVSLVGVPMNGDALRVASARCAELVRKGLVSSETVNAVCSSSGAGPRPDSLPGRGPSLRERIKAGIAEELRGW